ncbi:hypothetical protein JKP88DRAFT_273860 [Tribonema minus]|uniref:Uncharacterized protein n=1 Tax=Tribonema minus TaxID=303371 RepID=A0A835YWU7_9STRA|nr:hypothetical protein JKP88DRAFT_273860 [Tribonema minus]
MVRAYLTEMRGLSDGAVATLRSNGVKWDGEKSRWFVSDPVSWEACSSLTVDARHKLDGAGAWDVLPLDVARVVMGFYKDLLHRRMFLPELRVKAAAWQARLAAYFDLCDRRDAYGEHVCHCNYLSEPGDLLLGTVQELNRGHVVCDACIELALEWALEYP